MILQYLLTQQLHKHAAKIEQIKNKILNRSNNHPCDLLFKHVVHTKKKGHTKTGPVWKATNRDEPKNDLIPNIFDEVPLAQISETDIQGVDNIPVWYEYKNNSLLDNDSIITYNCRCGGSSKSDLEECCTTDGESVDYCAKMAQ